MDIHPHDIDGDEVVGDVLIRILSARLTEDPVTPKNEKKEPITYLPVFIQPEEILHICQLAEKSFQQQEVLLQIDQTFLPIHVVADLHGQIGQAMRIFRNIGSPQKETFLFLGDYVDRGVQGIETMLLLFCLKIRYPFQLFLLRGNHEDINPTLNYGFYEECLLRFDKVEKGLGEKIYRAFLAAFGWMPLAALIYGKRAKIFCAHGGISPHINNLDDINTVKRPLIIPPYGIACDLVWSDPIEGLTGWAMSPRWISYNYGKDIIEKFCEKNRVDIIIRGHQINDKMQRSGYHIFPGGRLITIFSAPNYTGNKNSATVLRIDERLKLQFNVFRVLKFSSEISPKRMSSLTLFRKKPSKSNKISPPLKPQAKCSAELDTEVDCSRELLQQQHRMARASSGNSQPKTPVSIPAKTPREVEASSSYIREKSTRSEYMEVSTNGNKQKKLKEEEKLQRSNYVSPETTQEKSLDEVEKPKRKKKSSAPKKKKT